MIMRKKTLLTCLIIAAIALAACQAQGNKINETATDIGGKTWTDGFEFFTATKCDSGFNCEGGTLHEGGLLFMLVPTEEGFVSANGFRGVDKNDSDYWEGYVFNGEVGEKYLPKNYDDKTMLVRYDKNGKAIGVYYETKNMVETMNADLIRYMFSGEFTKDDGTKVVFSADKPEVTGLSAETNTYKIPTVYDMPSAYITLGKETYQIIRIDEGIKVQPVKHDPQDEELWEEAGSPMTLKRVADSDDQTGNLSKEPLTTSQLEYFTEGERQKMLNALKVKGDKASEIEVINMQLLEKIAAKEMENATE
jgi:hypothetical protein